MTEYNIHTSMNDLITQTSGLFTLIVNQSRKNSCLLYNNKDLSGPIWKLDIRAEQIIAFPSDDWSHVIIYKLLDGSLFCEIYSLKDGLIVSYSYDDVKTIHCIYRNYISYKDQKGLNWIMEIDDDSEIKSSYRTVGACYDLHVVNDVLVYLEIINSGMSIMVDLVSRRYSETNRYFVGLNCISYMSVQGNLVTISVNSIKNPKRSNVIILEINNINITKKFEDIFDSSFTGYVFLHQDLRKLLIPLQNQGITQLYIGHLRESILNNILSIYTLDPLHKISGNNWIFNQNDNFKTIVGTSSKSQKMIVFNP